METEASKARSKSVKAGTGAWEPPGAVNGPPKDCVKILKVELCIKSREMSRIVKDIQAFRKTLAIINGY